METDKTDKQKYKEIRNMLSQIIDMTQEQLMKEGKYSYVNQRQKGLDFVITYNAVVFLIALKTNDINEKYNVVKATYEEVIKRQNKDKQNGNQ